MYFLVYFDVYVHIDAFRSIAHIFVYNLVVPLKINSKFSEWLKQRKYALLYKSDYANAS